MNLVDMWIEVAFPWILTMVVAFLLGAAYTKRDQ